MYLQVYRFLVVGVINTVLNYTVFYLLFIVGVDYRISGVSGFLSGGVLGFFLNRRWTFGSSSRETSTVIKYVLVQAFSLLGHSVAQILVVEMFFVHELISQVIGIMVSMSINFTLLKLYVFANKK